MNVKLHSDRFSKINFSMWIGEFAKLLASWRSGKTARHFQRSSVGCIAILRICILPLIYFGRESTRSWHCCRRHEVALHEDSSCLFADAACIEFHVFSSVAPSNTGLRTRSAFNIFDVRRAKRMLRDSQPIFNSLASHVLLIVLGIM